MKKPSIRPVKDSPIQGSTWVESCERQIGYTFLNKDLLYEALRHASSSGSRLDSNERLEFLGDAVLGFTVCEMLFDRFPEWLEGELTQIKSILVSRHTCARIAHDLQLDQCLVLGKGVSRDEAIPRSVLANAFESTIGAIYLDRGFDEAKKFILGHLEKELRAAVAGTLEKNHKSEFQQYCQKQFGQSPRYQLLSETGPDHSKTFEVCAVVGNRRFSPAVGYNKKVAEQRAAGNAMADLANAELPFPIERDTESPQSAETQDP